MSQLSCLPLPADEKRRLSRFLPPYSTCKSVVQKFLRENPRSRGSDKLLISLVDNYCMKCGIRKFSHESITRARRRFNQEGLYLPSIKTCSVRKNKQLAFREAAREGLL